jgi:hypothetical protein
MVGQLGVAALHDVAWGDLDVGDRPQRSSNDTRSLALIGEQPRRSVLAGNHNASSKSMTL